MSRTVFHLLRVPLTIAAVGAVLAAVAPAFMSMYAPYVVRPGIACAQTRFADPTAPTLPAGGCRGLSDLYGTPFVELFVESAFRSLALLIGAAVLALAIGTLLGFTVALLRRRVVASSVILGSTTLVAAVPAFFVAYFLQIIVIVVGASPTGGRLLPVHGFGYDEHLVLPLLSIALPAVAITAQLAATRLQEVLDSDFITTATAKGLSTPWILRVHVLPHARPVLLEGLGSGMRVSVASLPIIEFLFGWRGIGQLALEAVGVHDAAGFVFCAIVFTALFTILSALAELSRPRALYAAA